MNRYVGNILPGTPIFRPLLRWNMEADYSCSHMFVTSLVQSCSSSFIYDPAYGQKLSEYQNSPIKSSGLMQLPVHYLYPAEQRDLLKLNISPEMAYRGISPGKARLEHEVSRPPGTLPEPPRTQ